MHLHIHLLAAAVAMSVFSCAKSTIDPETIVQPDYSPWAEGHWIDYAVSVVSIDAKTAKHDTVQYFLREEVDRAIDSSGDEVKYRILRKLRYSSSDQWLDMDAILAIVGPSGTVRQEDNVPVLSLPVPLYLGKKWNCNAFNTLAPQESRITAIHTADSAYPQFDSVLTVVLHEEESLIQINKQQEKYACRFGLIEQYIIDAYSPDIQIDAQGNPLPVLQRAEKARVRLMKYIGSGSY